MRTARFSCAAAGAAALAVGCASGVPAADPGDPDAAASPGPDAPPPDAAPSPDGPAPVGFACFQAPSFPDSDGCGAAMDVTAAAAAPGGAAVYGDTTGFSDDLEPDSERTGGFTMDGPDAIYRAALAAGDVVTVELITDSASFDGTVYVLDGCSSYAGFIAGASAVSGPGVECVTFVAPRAATYYVAVDSYHASEAGCFALRVALSE